MLGRYFTWEISVITATEVKYIADEQQCPNFHGREFSIDIEDFQARWDSGVYKKGPRRFRENMQKVGFL